MADMTMRRAWSNRYGAAQHTRPHKYGARAVVRDGIRFDSMKEARRYLELALLQRAGTISKLDVHPMYTITVVRLSTVTSGGPVTTDALETVGVYTPDFRYVDASGDLVVEDVKSGPTKTTAYRLRKKLVEAIHGITITEI
jgi:hypothetical protein